MILLYTLARPSVADQPTNQPTNQNTVQQQKTEKDRKGPKQGEKKWKKAAAEPTRSALLLLLTVPVTYSLSPPSSNKSATLPPGGRSVHNNFRPHKYVTSHTRSTLPSNARYFTTTQTRTRCLRLLARARRRRRARHVTRGSSVDERR